MSAQHYLSKREGGLPLSVPWRSGGQQLFTWFPPLLMVLLLGYLSGRDFLLFHTLAEFFTIAVAVLAALVAWQTHPFSRNHLLMFLGCGYFWIGMLDLIHTLTYKGMGVYPFNEANPATQFWIAARYFEALLLLAAPWFLTRPFERRLGFLAFGAVSLLLYGLILRGHFPDAYLEGSGLTAFKINSEYLIIALLAVALARLWQVREALGETQLWLLSGAILFTILAEFAFTTYISVYDGAITLGHMAKLVSFWLLFVAIVRLTLTEPFRAMAHDATSYDAVPDPTMVIDTAGNLRRLNHAARELAGNGKGAGRHIGQPIHTLFHDPSATRHDCPVCRAIERGERLDKEPLFITPAQRWYEVTLSPIHGPVEVAGMVHVMRDVTEATLAKRALETSEARYRAIMERAGDAVFLVNDEGRLVDANLHAEKLLGFDHAEFLTMTPYDCHPLEEHGRVREGFKALARGESLIVPFMARHKDGSSIPVEVAGSTVHVEGRPYVVGIFRDQRERLAAEEREQQLEAQLTRIERLSSAGEIATSLAHELNQPLAAVVNFAGGCANRLRRGEVDAEKLLPAIEQIIQQGRLAGDTIHRLRAYLRGDDPEIRSLSLAGVTDSALALLDGKLRRSGARLHLQLNDVPPILADPVQLQQVLVNLILNALDAMDRLPIEERMLEIEAAEVEEERIEVIVRDHGPGVANGGAERIFEPFHSTKDGRLGMGLATCRTIIEAHHGHIEARNEGGLAVRFVLPKA